MIPKTDIIPETAATNSEEAIISRESMAVADISHVITRREAVRAVTPRKDATTVITIPAADISNGEVMIREEATVPPVVDTTREVIIREAIIREAEVTTKADTIRAAADIIRAATSNSEDPEEEAPTCANPDPEAAYATIIQSTASPNP
jgi:hypothetical protein